MAQSSVAVSSSTDDEVVDAMAHLACRTGLVVHVILPRRPGLLAHARQIAAQDSLNVEADLRAHTVGLRFRSS